MLAQNQSLQLIFDHYGGTCVVVFRYLGSAENSFVNLNPVSPSILSVFFSLLEIAIARGNIRFGHSLLGREMMSVVGRLTPTLN